MKDTRNKPGGLARGFIDPEVGLAQATDNDKIISNMEHMYDVLLRDITLPVYSVFGGLLVATKIARSPGLRQIKDLHKRFQSQVGQMKRHHKALKCGDVMNYANDEASALRLQAYANAHFDGCRTLSEISLIARTTDELAPRERIKLTEKADQYCSTLFYLWSSNDLKFRE